MNIEQEIWEDFITLSDNNYGVSRSNGYANAHFGLKYDERGILTHNGTEKRLQNDEDYKIEQFLIQNNYQDIDWSALQKLYPSRPEIKAESDLPVRDWSVKKEKLRLYIPNHNAARDYLINIRWEDKMLCPRCEHAKIYIIESGRRFKCPKCELKYSEKFGTVFNNSNLELLKWYDAIYLLKELKTTNISTVQLGKAIEVTQLTAWRMSKKIQSKIHYPFIMKIKQGLQKI